MDKFAHVKKCEPVYRAWFTHVRKWSDKGEWRTYNGSTMTDVRNSIRALLKDGGLADGRITINKNSGIDDLVPIFIPS